MADNDNRAETDITDLILAEEERDVIPDFREHSDEVLRYRLGGQWVAFHAEHRAARGISGEDIDPQEYIVENS